MQTQTQTHTHTLSQHKGNFKKPDKCHPQNGDGISASFKHPTSNVNSELDVQGNDIVMYMHLPMLMTCLMYQAASHFGC